MYRALIDNAQQTYIEYTEKRNNVTRIYNLINSIAPEDTKAMSPTEELDEGA